MSEEKKDLTKEEAGTTTEGKKFVVGGPDSYGMYYLKYEGGGQIPHEYVGSKWTELKEIETVCLKLNS